MPLSAGDKLGPYEILASIGAGGMGEVYRARDPRLNRDVAIKVSAAQFSERFEREAKAIAALNHPNICQIYDVGPNYLVMEFIEGEAPKGPMPLDEALRIARQIADALEAAHDKGITHRDLKPGNIKIKPNGTVKVLDFGLAKVNAGPSASGENSPTLTMGMSQAGMILGTAAYMAPEQARGKENVDKRTDIWAFSVVLYELITGKRLFQGEDVGEILAAVIKEQPSLDDVPLRVRPLLKRCLEKDPQKRLRDIGDMELLLVESGAGSQPVAASQAVSRRPVAWIAATALLALVAFGVSFIHFRETPPPERTLRYTIAAPENSTVNSFAVSPDGRYVAIAAAVQGKRQLWLRALDALQPQAMPGTEDAANPFWSPDSRYIGFFAQGKLKKVAASGGPAQSLCDAAAGNGGSWNRNDEIVFSPFGTGNAIQRVPAAGGVPADVTKTKGNYRYPVFLPDGRRFLYSVVGLANQRPGVYMNSLDGSEDRQVLADVSGVTFAAGHVLFIRENTLMAARFDARNGGASGDAFPIVAGVSLNANSYAPMTASENGVLLYQSSRAAAIDQIVWFDRAGKLLGSVGAPGSIAGLSLSPDEKMMAFSNRTLPTADIWLRDLARGTNTRFTFDGSGNFEPLWSPKGDRIVFASNRAKSQDLYQKPASGSIKDELLVSTPNTKVADQWSRDGRFIVYSEVDPKTKWDLWVLPIGQSGGKPVPFLQTEFNEFQGQLSPDGRWMAYASDESGQREVYVRPFPASGGKWRISAAGGEQPRWRGDGKELFFAGADGKMMAVAVKAVTEPERAFETGSPMALFDSHIEDAGAFLPFLYDVTADGKRFLVDTNTAGASTPQLNVVVNWSVGLKK